MSSEESFAANEIFNYKTNTYEEINYPIGSVCEDICITLSKQLGILPSARHLFGLRIQGTKYWLPLCVQLKSSVKYEFRLRFKVADLSTFKKLDISAYDYFYRQCRHDLVYSKIEEIKYPRFKDHVLGLGVVDMYIDMMEKNLSVDDLEKSYKKYIPTQLLKKHHIFAKKKISEGLREIKKKDHDIYYVKGTYLDSINTMAPHHLIEEYKGLAFYLPEDELEKGTCPVIIQINPFHETQPGIRVFYKYKNEWKHITELEAIYALFRVEGKKFVRLDLRDLPKEFHLGFSSQDDLDSFVTCVSGYYRLSIKWMMDLCVLYTTPSLLELKEVKCHGPVGGDFSYGQIRDRISGSYLVRQCERQYDIYYIDIKISNADTETFKITRDNKNQWLLHIRDTIRPFKNLTELALSIETAGRKMRIPPSDYEQPASLLICLPINQLRTKETVSEVSEAELHRKRGQIFDPQIDLQWHKNSEKDCEGGKMTETRADWIVAHNRYLPVTLKSLKSEKHFSKFMDLANNWSKMYSSEFLKLYGLTLSTPRTMVMEYAKWGPLNEFLVKFKENTSILCLLEAVHGLVRAVVYMQEKRILHGFLRCCQLHVTKFNENANILFAKLADPGFGRPYTNEDFPWIPFEYYPNMELAKKDHSAELWAFATTVWEIFSRGKAIKHIGKDELRENYGRTGGILPLPADDCPEDMYSLIMDGWSYDPDKRFNQQMIFTRLASIKESLASSYETVDTMSTSFDSSSTRSRSTILSTTTDNTVVNGNSSGSDARSLASYSDDKMPLLNGRNHNTSNNLSMYPQSYFGETPAVLFIKDARIIHKEKIGEGHYGTVYRGEIQYNNSNLKPSQVAIKTLKCSDGRALNNHDFIREIKIMETLNHRNIVKIIASAIEPQVSIIMEYVESGSFIVYLSSKRPNLTNSKLLRFAMDIANGMEYLRSKKVIHRDLAARNILVNRNSDCAKISDFGLAQIADSNGYYIVKNSREIPIKWYSPETIETNKFSFQSDVWSYGVTLFEMFSRGGKPNLSPRELDANEFLSALKRGERLRKPYLCSDKIYDRLMYPCWHDNPKNRPNFTQILAIIKNIIDEDEGEYIS